MLRPLTVSILSERRAVAPPGLAGGKDAQRGVNLLLRRDGRTVSLGSKATAEFVGGERLRILTPGAPRTHGWLSCLCGRSTLARRHTLQARTLCRRRRFWRREPGGREGRSAQWTCSCGYARPPAPHERQLGQVPRRPGVCLEAASCGGACCHARRPCQAASLRSAPVQLNFRHASSQPMLTLQQPKQKPPAKYHPARDLHRMHKPYTSSTRQACHDVQSWSSHR